MFNWINPSRCQGHLYKQTGNKKNTQLCNRTKTKQINHKGKKRRRNFNYKINLVNKQNPDIILKTNKEFRLS